MSEVAYQNAATYARDRLQGRALGGPKFPDKPADPIIVHPDVRRMLMAIRAFNEGARALVIWTALQGDVEHRSPDEKARQAAADHMGLLTPVIKGVLTDQGFANAVMAQQVYGGHGYIREQGMEQFVRDARIAMIYEGANGVQAMDLVGRKLPRDGGRALQAFFTEVQGFIKENGGDAMKPFVAPLGVALGHLQQATMWLMQNAMAKPDNAGAAANDYMHLFGRVAIGYMWCRIVEGGAGQACGRRRRAHEREARHRPLFHGAHAAGDRDASRAHPVGRREHDGPAGGGVLNIRIAMSRRWPALDGGHDDFNWRNDGNWRSVGFRPQPATIDRQLIERNVARRDWADRRRSPPPVPHAALRRIHLLQPRQR